MTIGREINGYQHDHTLKAKACMEDNQIERVRTLVANHNALSRNGVSAKQ